MHDTSVSLLLTSLLFLLLVSAFFSAAEIGMMSLNRYRLRHLVRNHDKRALRVQKLLSRTDRLLGVILIGNTFANILASAVATLVAAKLLGDFGVFVVTILLTLVVLIFSEVAPKTIASIYPMRTAFLASKMLQLLLAILYPVVWLVNLLANGVLKLFGVDLTHRAREALSHEELRSVVDDANNLIPEKHKNMLLGILDLTSTSVDEIMIPRGEIVGIDLNEPWADIIDGLITSQHTRVPVYRGSLSDIQGLLHIRDVSKLLADEDFNQEQLLTVLEPVYYTPIGTPLATQLLNFQQNRSRLGFVVDEYGAVHGLVTLEDILEEVVGQFTTDYATWSKDIHPQKDGSVVIDGSITLHELNRAQGWVLPETGPKTLSGLIIEILEAIPNAGTCLKINDMPMEILRVQDNMVKTVQVWEQKIEDKGSAQKSE